MPGSADYAAFETDVKTLRQSLTQAGELRPSQAALDKVREVIPYMTRDRAMDGEVQRICALVASGRLVA